MNNSNLVHDFIDKIWNKQLFEKLDDFLHPHYQDYSLPPTFSNNKEGTKNWIIGTGLSFEHDTIIENQVTEGNYTIVKIKMKLKHIGSWRGIEATGIELQTIGYRQFRIKNGKIIEHHGLIDGQTIENALSNTNHGCKIAE